MSVTVITSWAQLCYHSWSGSEVVLCSSMIKPVPLMWLIYAPISWWRTTFRCYHGLPSVMTGIPSKMCGIFWANWGLHWWKNRRPFHRTRSDVTIGSWGDGLLLYVSRSCELLNFEIKKCHFVDWGYITVWFWFSLNKLARCSNHLLLCPMADVLIQ